MRVTSNGEIDFVGVGVLRALLTQAEDADGRCHRHFKEPTAAALRRHITLVTRAQTAPEETAVKEMARVVSAGGRMKGKQTLRNHAACTC